MSKCAVAIGVDDDERAALDRMAAAIGGSDEDVIRTALYRFAVHLDFDPPIALFALRGRGATGRRRRLKSAPV